MSRTKKDSRIEKKKRTTVRKKKMKPYVGEDQVGLPKFEAEAGLGMGITKEGKLIAKNANRSRKKAARREGKKAIKNGWDRVWNDAIDDPDFNDY